MMNDDFDESGFFVPPPKPPAFRKKLDKNLKNTISKMLQEIIFDFDEKGG